ncbi:LytTR family DNA-binding domain-containing protein [Arsenicibacter rosenii]|uniref:LytTR family DNA-binding domain-containing protein n=1 Tax=Arsenicibacter rosenii TaxID=1750698 RepID=UPI0035B5B79D
MITSADLSYYDRALVRFIRASRDYLVNPDYIIRAERIHSREMYLTMIDGTRLRVSRRNVYFVGVILETYKQQLLHESSPRALAYQDEPVGRKRSADQPLLVPVE